MNISFGIFVIQKLGGVWLEYLVCYIVSAVWYPGHQGDSDSHTHGGVGTWKWLISW